MSHYQTSYSLFHYIYSVFLCVFFIYSTVYVSVQPYYISFHYVRPQGRAVELLLLENWVQTICWVPTFLTEFFADLSYEIRTKQAEISVLFFHAYFALKLQCECNVRYQWTVCGHCTVLWLAVLEWPSLVSLSACPLSQLYTLVNIKASLMG